MHLLLRRRGTMIELSPDGSSALPPAIVQQLHPQLSYTYKQFYRGQAAYDPVSGARETMSFSERQLYQLEAGRLVTGYGFIPRLAQTLAGLGHTVHFRDDSLPRERPRCYEPDWNNFMRYNVRFRPRQFDCVMAIANSQGGVINAPPGFGKTHVITVLCMLYPFAKVAIVVKPVAVAARIVRQLTRYFANVGYVGGGSHTTGRITVITADSLHNYDGDADFLFVDECLPGDTPVATPTGAKLLSDVVVGDKVLCYDGHAVTTRPVTRVWAKGPRSVLRITTVTGRVIRCTSNHLLYTQRGWMPAGQLLLTDRVLCIAPVVAGHSSEKASGADSITGYPATDACERGPSGSNSTRQPCGRPPCAPVAAVATYSYAAGKTWTSLFSRAACWLGQTLCRGIKRVRPSMPTSSPGTNDRLSSARCWVTPPSATRMPRAGIPGSILTMVAPRRPGLGIKPVSSATLACVSRWRRTRASGRSLFAVLADAFRRSVRFLTWCVRAADRSESRWHGSCSSGLPGWPGGSVTTAARVATTYGCTQRATTRSLCKLPRPGFNSSTDQSPWAGAGLAVGFSRSPGPAGTQCPAYPGMCQPACPTNFESLSTIERLPGVENVYDIEVADCHNFFANGLLVHNCHLIAAPTHSEALGRTFLTTRNYGFTATPEGRLDGADLKLEYFFGPQIFTMTYQEAVTLGLVAPIFVRWLPIALLQNPAAGKQETARLRWGIWRNQARNSAIAADARTYGNEHQVLILTATLEHAVYLWQFLPEYALCYSQIKPEDLASFQKHRLLPINFRPMSPTIRDQMRNDFERGTLKKVIATDVWSTGVDFEALQTLYRADARESVIMDTQGPGRVSRVHGSKEYGEVVDCMDLFDRSLMRKSEARSRHYKKLGWDNDWASARRSVV